MWILPSAHVVPSLGALALLCLLVCRLSCVLCVPLIPSSGGLPHSSQGSLVEPLAPLPSSSGSSTPPSPMSCPLPELPADSSHIEVLSEAAFWCGEMVRHHSMVISSHHSYDLAAKAYLEAVEKLVMPLGSRKGNEKEGK